MRYHLFLFLPIIMQTLSKILSEKISSTLILIRVAFFLAVRYVRRTSLWTTSLIVFVMTLTFLNLVMVSGILVGLIQGSSDGFKHQYSGDVFISKLVGKNYIERSGNIIETLRTLPEVSVFSPRYLEAGRVEANYLTRVNDVTQVADTVGAEMTGIDPEIEDQTTGLASKVIAGSYLNKTDSNSILIGSQLLEQYSTVNFSGLDTISNVVPGSKVRVTIGTITKEFTVKGIIKSKVNNVGLRVFFVDSELRKLLQRTDYNVDEIAIKLKPGVDSSSVTSLLKASGLGQYALIRTSEESQGTFLEQIKTTFAMLGNVIGSISLVVASITVFIVIFITAITRRKFIGILKGIGISAGAIELSYILLSLFYAVIGISIGALILYGFAKPFFDVHPINFPFSDGILVADYGNTAFRSLLILIATVIAGYIPARLIVRKNTLDAILGR
jgi:ABC-type lipoprotein release transport system permease subunit